MPDRDRSDRRKNRDDSRETSREKSRDRKRKTSRRSDRSEDSEVKSSRDRRGSRSRRSSSRGKSKGKSHSRSRRDDSRDRARRRSRSKSKKKRGSKSPTRPTDWRSQIKWDSPSRSPSRSRRKSQSRSKSRSRDRDRRGGGGGTSAGFQQDSSRKSKWDDGPSGAVVPVPAPPVMPAPHGRPSGPGLLMLLQQPGTKAVRVPDLMVGRVVGKGGQMIKKLNEISGCQIGMERDHSGSYALIRGPTKEMADRAEELIMKEMKEAAMKLPDQEKLRLMNDEGAGNLIQAAFLAATRTFQIGIEHIPRVLGAGGDTIYAIQRDAGCTVKIEGNGTVVLTRGTPQQMDHAQALVMAAVEESKQLLNEKGKAGKAGKGFPVAQPPPPPGGLPPGGLPPGGLPPPPPPLPLPALPALPPAAPSIQLNGKGKEQYMSMSSFAAVGLGAAGGTQL